MYVQCGQVPAINAGLHPLGPGLLRQARENATGDSTGKAKLFKQTCRMCDVNSLPEHEVLEPTLIEKKIVQLEITYASAALKGKNSN